MSVLGAAGLPLLFWAALWCSGVLVAWLARPTIGWAAPAGLPVAVVIVTLTSWLQMWASYTFSWVTVIVAWLCACCVALAFRTLRRGGYRSENLTVTSARPRAVDRSFAAWGLALGGSVALAMLVLWGAGGGSWEIVSQTWDAMFDANAVRHIHDTGLASPSTISDFASWRGLDSYYPTGFHSLAALYMHLAGCDAVVATNVTAGLLAGGLWPSTVVLGVRFLYGPSLRITGAALALAWGFWGLPWGPLGWGVLWATSMAGMMTPLVFAGLLGAHGMARVNRSRTVSVAVLVGGLVAVTLFHPRITVPVVALCYAFWLVYAVVKVRSLFQSGGSPRRWILSIVGSLLGLAVFVLKVGRGDSTYAARGWPVEFGFGAEIAQYAVNAPARSVPQLISGGLVIVGAYLAARKPRDRHLVVLLVGAVALDVLTATLRDVSIFDGLARFWYGDRYRTIGLPPFPSILVALVAMTGSRRLRESSRAALATGAALVVLWGAIAGNLYLRGSYIDAATHPQESVVSPSEIDFYRRVADVVPVGERVLNNANDGSALIYAYTGRMPVFLIAGVRPGTEHGVVLWDSLTKMNSQELCTILRLDGVRWVLNGGPAYSKGIIAAQAAPGMQVPHGFWAVTSRLREGDHVLYEVTGCPP